MGSIKAYQDKSLLYDLYVRKRMGIKQMSEMFKNNYNCIATPQTIYNWLEKYDLLKYRGKGRKINIGRGTKSQGAKKTGPYAPVKSTAKKKPGPYAR